jgi:hypothetical protein
VPEVSDVYLRLLRGCSGVPESVEVGTRLLRCALCGYEVAKVCGRCLRYTQGH